MYAYTAVLCVLLVSQCVSFYISINICRRLPSTSMLMTEQPKKEKKTGEEKSSSQACIPPALHAQAFYTFLYTHTGLWVYVNVSIWMWNFTFEIFPETQVYVSYLWCTVTVIRRELLLFNIEGHCVFSRSSDGMYVESTFTENEYNFKILVLYLSIFLFCNFTSTSLHSKGKYCTSTFFDDFSY